MGGKEKLPFSTAALSMDIAATKRIDLFAKAFPGTISLAQGIPSFKTALHIKEAAIKAIGDGLVDKYTVGYGIEPLREAITKKVARDNGIETTPQGVIVTHGGIEAVMASLLAIVDRDDDVIVLTPDYASHFNQIAIPTGGRGPIHVPLTETENDWVLDPERLAGAITERTKAVLLTNPCNPTGKVYTKDELQGIAQIASEHNLYIISDEMYEYFTFDGKTHTSIASFPEVADRTISIFGLSKSYAMTGWRVGYVVAGQDISDQIFKVHDSLATCATAVSQYAALAAVEGPQDVVADYQETFRKRRQIVMDELTGVKSLHLPAPQGTYYAFPRIGENVDDNELVISLVKDAGVAVIPGSAFGKGGESHVRISFGAEEDILREGLRRFAHHLTELG